jgi:invasion protein IalB
VLALIVATSPNLALTQTATEDTTEGAGDLSLGASDEPALGETYSLSEHGDWSLRCVKTEDPQDPCQLYQLLQDQDGNSVAEISMFNLPEGGPAVAGATIITPLETLLTQQVLLGVDAAEKKRYPFTFCSQIGCFSRVGFTEAEVESFRRGTAMNMTIVPAAAPTETVELTVSLVGFTAGMQAMIEANTPAN